MSLPKSNIKKYITGGNATITLKNKTKGTSIVFRFVQGKKQYKDTFHVRCMSEYGGFSYIGFFKKKEDGSLTDIITTSKTTFYEDSREMKTAKWLISKIDNKIPDSVDVEHNGSCSRCGRELTDPDSIASGFGPVCRKKLSI